MSRMAERRGGRARTRPRGLPAAAPPPARPRKPWQPASLREADVDYRQLWYVLVEEKVSDAFGLRVSPWPGAGKDGLPVFADPEAELEVGAGEAELQERLNRVRRPPPGVGLSR